MPRRLDHADGALVHAERRDHRRLIRDHPRLAGTQHRARHALRVRHAVSARGVDARPERRGHDERCASRS
jgi:hypothetical protein